VLRVALGEIIEGAAQTPALTEGPVSRDFQGEVFTYAVIVRP
jgi:hypothetical protein